MTRVDLDWEHLDGTKADFSFSIGNISGGRVSRYCIRHQAAGNTADRFLDYPRWSEPVQGLVARALALLPMDVDATVELQVKQVSCTTLLDRHGLGSTRRLARLGAAVGPRAWTVRSEEGEGQPVRRRLHPTSPTPLKIALEALCAVVWKSQRVPQPPPPLSIPTHKVGRYSYVRLADVPSHARAAFSQFLHSRTQLQFPDEGECAYTWDWETFLGR